MNGRRFALLGVALIGACQALPSSVPLANSGGVLGDTGTDRDKRSTAATPPLPFVEEKRSSALPVPTVAATSSHDVPADAGAFDGASASGDAGVGSVAWAGEYYGSDKLVRHYDGESDDVELDDKAHTRVEEKAPGALLITIVNSATGDTICALRATGRGNLATLDPGQSCFGEEGANASVTDGRVSLTGDRLVLEFNGKVVISGGDDDDEDGDGFEFRLEYHFDGRRR